MESGRQEPAGITLDEGHSSSDRSSNGHPAGVTLDDVEVAVWRVLGLKETEQVDRVLKVVQAYGDARENSRRMQQGAGGSEIARQLVEQSRQTAQWPFGLVDEEAQAEEADDVRLRICVQGSIGATDLTDLTDKISSRIAPQEGVCVWTDVPGYEGLYRISAMGEVKSYHGREPKILATKIDKDGYKQLNLTKDGKQRTMPLHVLVMRAFVGERPEGMETRHLNGDKTDNRLANLAYGTKEENAQDKIAHGAAGGPPEENRKKTHCKHGHMFSASNTRVRKDGTRACRACDQAYRQNNAGGTPAHYAGGTPAHYAGDGHSSFSAGKEISSEEQGNSPGESEGEKDAAYWGVNAKDEQLAKAAFDAMLAGVVDEGATSPRELRCSRCQQVKPVDAFAVDRSRGRGRRWRCRECEAKARVKAKDGAGA